MTTEHGFEDRHTKLVADAGCHHPAFTDGMPGWCAFCRAEAHRAVEADEASHELIWGGEERQISAREEQAFDLALYARHKTRIRDWDAVPADIKDAAMDTEARIERTYPPEVLAEARNDPDGAAYMLRQTRLLDGWDPEDSGLGDT